MVVGYPLWAEQVLVVDVVEGYLVCKGKIRPTANLIFRSTLLLRLLHGRQ